MAHVVDISRVCRKCGLHEWNRDFALPCVADIMQPVPMTPEEQAASTITGEDLMEAIRETARS